MDINVAEHIVKVTGELKGLQVAFTQIEQQREMVMVLMAKAQGRLEFLQSLQAAVTPPPGPAPEA